MEVDLRRLLALPSPGPCRGLAGDHLGVGGAVLVDAPGPQHEPTTEEDEDESDESDEEREGEADEEEVEGDECALALPEGDEPDGAEHQDDATEQFGVGGDGDGVLPVLGDLVVRR